MARWRCTVCGWTCSDESSTCPPDRCPKCGVPKSKFIKLK
ncbi:MAG: rubredoxin-like domain-containing protein [Candidatus Helarchaeota archaeon]